MVKAEYATFPEEAQRLLEQKDTEIEQLQNEKTAETTALQTTIVNLNDTIRSLKSEITVHEKEIKLQRVDIMDYKLLLIDEKEKCEKQKGDKEKKEDEIRELSGRIFRLEEEIEGLGKENDGKNKKVDECNRKIHEQEVKINELGNSLRTVTEDHNRAADLANTRLEESEVKEMAIKRLESDLKEKNAILAEYRRLNQLVRENEELKTRIESSFTFPNTFDTSTTPRWPLPSSQAKATLERNEPPTGDGKGGATVHPSSTI